MAVSVFDLFSVGIGPSGDVPGGGGFSALSVALSTTWKAIVQRSVRTD